MNWLEKATPNLKGEKQKDYWQGSRAERSAEVDHREKIGDSCACRGKNEAGKAGKNGKARMGEGHERMSLVTRKRDGREAVYRGGKERMKMVETGTMDGKRGAAVAGFREKKKSKVLKSSHHNNNHTPREDDWESKTGKSHVGFLFTQ